ncbi:MAG: YfcE family phosphodiesterase [Flavobacteriales bacterium]|nr:YfcE family phosphodiesterase [Flavobacteriales bacterium]|tara:strand:- start:134 stop:637 length:504 start_codon:yes stop_codon:yes gene_type:complete
MTKILILSDTHSFLDTRLKKHIRNSDIVCHAGDIGDIAIIDEINTIKPVVAVHGNIDNHTVKTEYPKNQIFKIHGKKIVITHIAGYPNRYNNHALNLIKIEQPDIFVCGHSHILKIMYDHKLNHLHINPGACGKHGFHKIQTAVKLEILENGEIKNCEIIELLHSIK